MKSWTPLNAWVILSIVLSTVITGCTDSQRKSEWAFLQNTEFKFRKQPVSEMTFRSDGEFRAVGIWSEQAATNVWILLNPRTTPLYKQLPQVQFSITEGEFQKISKLNVNDTIIECLASHVAKHPERKAEKGIE